MPRYDEEPYGRGVREEQDLVVPPGEYALLLDSTKGNVDVIVGPQKTSLSATDSPVFWDRDAQTFEACSQARSKQKFVRAREGQYIVLHNPVAANEKQHPNLNGRASAVELATGRKVNLQGPDSFALFPGQEADVLDGHHLRSNQYLMIRVYNDQLAMSNWNSAVVKGAEGEEAQLDVPNLHMGQLLIIRGTDVSFYMPPTGVEVVMDERGNYVREAETLERLEFCILLNEDGNKRYVVGPDVVFPQPTEQFVSQDGNRKGRAIELNGISGIYLKVIEAYDEEVNGETVHHPVGEELFITGNESAIYYPSEHHSIIKYGDRVIHYAVAIPEGEGRYVMNRETAEIKIERGASMFLPNPIKEVIVRRILTDRECQLLYPNNTRVLEYNRSLREAGKQNADSMAMASMALSEDIDDAAQDFRRAARLASFGGATEVRGRSKMLSYEETGADTYASAMPVGASAYSNSQRSAAEELIGSPLGDTTQRKRQHTRPRTLVLDTDLDGCVTVAVQNNYAAMFVRKNGDRRVVVGPETVLLEYDERPAAMKFNSGASKETNRVIESAFLQVRNNSVGDTFIVETSDGFDASLRVRYHLSFVGEDATKWFDIENYVEFLCNRMRAIIRREAKRHSITDLKNNAIDLLRDLVLGERVGESNNRPGRTFIENDLHLFDLEVSTPQIDGNVDHQLRELEQQKLQRTIAIEAKQAELAHIQQMEQLDQQILDARQSTADKRHELEKTQITHAYELSQARVDNEGKIELQVVQHEEARQAILDAIEAAANGRAIARNQVEIDFAKAKSDIDVNALRERAASVSPELAAAIRQLGDDQVVATVTEAIAPMSYLGGSSIGEIVRNLFEGTPLAETAAGILDRSNRQGAYDYRQ